MRQRTLRAAIAVAFALIIVPGSVIAAGPEIEKVSIDDPELEAADGAAESAECGFPVVIDYLGGFIVHVFAGGRHVDVTNYHMRGTFSNPANGKSVSFVDSGPDRVSIQAGHLIVAVTGRSTTGSGTIGQLVVDLETGEILQEAGRFVGTVYDDLCDRLD